MVYAAAFIVIDRLMSQPKAAIRIIAELTKTVNIRAAHQVYQ